jgi:hypothetical protein
MAAAASPTSKEKENENERSVHPTERQSQVWTKQAVHVGSFAVQVIWYSRRAESQTIC